VVCHVFQTRWVRTEQKPLNLYTKPSQRDDSTGNPVLGWVFGVEGVRECAQKSCMVDSWALSYTQHIIELIWVYSAGGGVWCASGGPKDLAWIFLEREGCPQPANMSVHIALVHPLISRSQTTPSQCRWLGSSPEEGSAQEPRRLAPCLFGILRDTAFYRTGNSIPATCVLCRVSIRSCWDKGALVGSLTPRDRATLCLTSVASGAENLHAAARQYYLPRNR
jgi:hypothetical protein